MIETAINQPDNKTIIEIESQIKKLIQNGIQPKCGFCTKEVVIEMTGDYIPGNYVKMNIIGYSIIFIRMDMDQYTYNNACNVEVFGSITSL